MGGGGKGLAILFRGLSSFFFHDFSGDDDGSVWRNKKPNSVRRAIKPTKGRKKKENENVQFISPVFHGLFRISGSKKGRKRRGVDQLANDVRKEEAKLIKYLNYLKVFYYYFLPVLEAALF